MRAPESLQSLVDEGVVEAVLRPLMSGKEAQVYLVRSDGELRVAKVYKDAQHRSFKQRAEYTEGRNVRNSRDQRAMTKRTRHGREQDEAAWRSAEVDMIYRLRAAGVRVPIPYHFVDGVLIMELVTDAEGNPAPRLGDLSLDAARATEVFDRVLAEVVRMLAAGVVHGDLSDFNVLMGTDGPVIIDFPQAVDASSNQNARKLLVRDVDNLHRFLSKFVPGRQPPPFAQEMWQLYERGELTPEVKLNGRYRASQKQVATDDVLALVGEAERDERKRRESLGQRMVGGSEGAVAESARAPEHVSDSRNGPPPRRQVIDTARWQSTPQNRRPPPQPRPPQQQQQRPPQQQQRPPQQQQQRPPQQQQQRPPQQQQQRPPQQQQRPPQQQQRPPQQQQQRPPQPQQPQPQLQGQAGDPAFKKKRRRRRKPKAALGAGGAETPRATASTSASPFPTQRPDRTRS